MPRHTNWPANHIVELTSNDAKMLPVDKPNEYATLDCLRQCPEDEFWPT